MKIRSGETILDLYQIISEPIEVGNTARIWKALHKDWNICLALKQPRDEYIAGTDGKENFRRECDTWVRLGHHPHIVPCFYVREIDNELIIFSEWCEGGSLQDVTDNGNIYAGTPKEQERRAVSIALQSALGLRYAHRMGVIHKDIKPANIMLDSKGAVRITDFGSSNCVSETGTQRYFSPEQLMNNTEKITCKTDIFSWALTISALHRGMRYWDEIGNNLDEYFEFMLPDFCIPMRKEYAQLIKSCLSAEPDDRPDADTIIKRTREIYGDILENDIALNYIDEEYAEETADSLNNAALSYLDIKEYRKSEECWKRALKLQSAHPESLYNYSIYLWENDRISNNELIERIKLMYSSSKDKYLEEAQRCIELKQTNSLIEKTTISPRPALCRFTPSDELFRNKQDFLRLKADFKKCIELNEYKTAVTVVNKISKIPFYGSSSECRNMKKKLFHYCNRSNFRALSTERFSEGVHRLRFSYDGKLFLKIGLKQYFDFTIPDNRIYVYETENLTNAIKCVYTENESIADRHTYVKDAWFTTDGNICFCEITVIPVHDNAASLRVRALRKKEEQIKEYDFKTGEVQTLPSLPENLSRHSIQPELIQFCKDYGYCTGAFDVNSDCTVLIAGDEDEFSVFDIDCDIQYDEK